MFKWIKSLFRRKKPEKNVIRFRLKDGRLIDVYYIKRTDKK